MKTVTKTKPKVVKTLYDGNVGKLDTGEYVYKVGSGWSETVYSDFMDAADAYDVFDKTEESPAVTKTQQFDGFQIDTYSDGTYGYMTDGGKHKEGYKSKDGAKKAAAKLAAKAAKAQEDAQAKLLEKQAQELQEKLQLTYADAVDGMTSRIEASLKGFAAEDAKWQADVAAGKKDAKAYDAWRKDQALHNDRLNALKKALTQDLTAADKMAMAYVNQVPAGVYAEGMNFATYEIEHSAKANTSFTLYNKNTVIELVANEPDLLPQAAFDKAKDSAWNSRHVASAVTQAVLQGQTVPQLAASIAGIAAMDQRAAMKAARTAITSAHSLGKLKGYERAAGMGIDVEKQWLAALDSRTRGSHRHLDGETVELDAEFSNGLKYPGDPDGPASEVYNCRCTLVPVIGDVEYDEVERANKLGGMSYEEWRAERSPTAMEATHDTHAVAQGRDIVGEWRRRPDEFDFEIEDVMAAQGYDGTPLLVDADEFDKRVKQANDGKGFIAQRSYTGASKEVADEYRRELYEGKWYVDCSTGGAQYGKGMYCAADYTGKLTDGIRAEMEHYTALGQERNKGAGSNAVTYVETMTLDPSAKVITYDDLMDYVYKKRIEKRLFREATEGMKFSEKELAVLHESILLDATREQFDAADNFFIEDRSGYYAAKRKLQSIVDGIKDKANSEFSAVEGMDPGAIAALHGYDAINAEGHGESGSYTVVLNRTKLIIKKPEEWK